MATFIFLWSNILLAQTDQDSIAWYQLQIGEDLPLKEAARNSEDPFYLANRQLDSLKAVAMQVNILSSHEMRSAGVTNIPEALQLLPEFVVRPKSNGLYRVEYRGSNAPSSQPGSAESLLLLINGQPYNDALTNEIWWEALPFTVDDLARIELIRSPHGTWFGYGGALAVVNLVTQSPTEIKGTMLNARLQAGTGGSHLYHVGLGMQVNEKLSGRVGAYFHNRNRLSDDYYFRSQDRYIPGDSILFYQPEALNTNPSLNRATQNRGFNLSSSYRINDSTHFRLDAASQNSTAQAPFVLSEEVSANTRTYQSRSVNLRFNAPMAEVQAFYNGGTQDLASGYAGMQYQNSQIGLRATYRRQLGRFTLLGGTEWLSHRFENTMLSVSGLPITGGMEPVNSWSKNLIAAYLQQKAHFFNNRLLIESGQRIYYTYQGQDFPLGYHVSLKWYAGKNISLQASTAQVLQASSQLFIHNRAPLRLRSYNFGIARNINRNQGLVRLSFFSQESTPLAQTPVTELQQYEIPLWGSTLEMNYAIQRLSLKLNTSWFDSKGDYETSLHPSVLASLQATYTTFFNKLNVHLGFFYHNQHENLVDNNRYEIPEQWLLNGKISYRAWKNFELFSQARNILNTRQVYVPLADPDFRLIMIGVNVSL